MFKNLSDRLGHVLQSLRGQGRLTEDNIRDSLREVRLALLEADVALPVVKEFIEHLRARAVGKEVLESLTPGQALVGIVHEELVRILGDATERFQLRAQPPAVVLLAGLQGSGKTTTTAKLARLLREREKKKVLVVSCDVYRPAAIQQLETVAGQVGVDYHPSQPAQKPADIAAAALDHARKGFYDALLVDTAGRLAIDEEMMAEIRLLHALLKPAETLFVVDSMTGQDAARTAAAFAAALPLTGVVLTKVDGDARGGAALSVRKIAHAPIKFLGVGEKLEALEPFHPQRVASRILGMGDILSLVEQAQEKVDQVKAEKLAKKIAKGQGFDLGDFREQLQQMQSMGGLSALVEKLPGAHQLPANLNLDAQEKQFRRMIAAINSMTPRERRYPELLKASRKRRIAAGSGTQVQDVNRLLRQFEDAQRAMKMFSKGGMDKMLKLMKNRLPPGLPRH
ncbi:MAG: signal recognition particle protein [Acidobacteria bacterium]|nr:signal recognition particle protein [Acidobacteriota bacterium]